MPQHGNDEIEMVGVQAGHETAHTRSADLSGPASSPTEWHRSVIHRVLVQSNPLRVIEPETTTGRTTSAYLWKTAQLRLPKAGMPGGGRPNSDPRYGGGGRGFQNRARYGGPTDGCPASR